MLVKRRWSPAGGDRERSAPAKFDSFLVARARAIWRLRYLSGRTLREIVGADAGGTDTRVDSLDLACNKMDEDIQLQQMVDRLYDEAGQPDSRKLHICTKEGVGAAAVYGEVTTPESIFKALNISAEDKFVDLGSGRGQLVLAASMRLAGPRPQSSTGVELIDLRHEEAKKAWEKAGPIVQSTSTVKCGDALAEDVTTTTKAFICNQTFPADLNAAFCKALAPDKAPQVGRTFPALLSRLSAGLAASSHVVSFRLFLPFPALCSLST